MNTENQIIVADKPTLPVFQISPTALQTRDEALSNAALIGRVENADQNKQAVDAHIFLKRVATSFEKARKTLKEPLIEAGRQLDRAVATELAEIEKEIGRIGQLTSEFQLAEQRRIREEQEAQQREIERIEREKQAEIQRIAREQSAREAEARRVAEEAERKAREEREAAAKAARDATNKKEREAAEKLLQESAKAEEARRIERERLAAASAAQAASELQLANERASAATLAEAKPIVAQRSVGQVVKTSWEYEVVNPILFAKMHPDCVQWEKLPVIAAQITQHLSSGMTLKGVTAKQVTKSTVRAGTSPLIEV